jgi:hypothetical protein
MLDSAKRNLKRLYAGRLGKVLLAMFLVGMVATAGASVFVFNYASGTANVQTPDVQMALGGDTSSTCSSYPCVTESVTSTHDVLTASMSFFPAATTSTPVPATYYSNFAHITNVATSGSHTILSVQVLNVKGTTADLGSITVYYCTTQTGFNASGDLVTPSDCLGSFSIVSSSGGSVFTGSQSIAAGAVQYIEVAAYAASGAAAGTYVTFQIAVQWV